jgi:anion-transporting  ArsA/GET3 family ATPase
MDTIIIDTPEGVAAFRLLALRSALSLEVSGLRVSRGRTAYAIVKEEFGLRGGKARVLEQYEDLLRERGVLVY